MRSRSRSRSRLARQPLNPFIDCPAALLNLELGKPFQRQLSPIPEVYIITNHAGAHPSLWSMGTPSITTCNNDGIDCLYQ